MNLTESDKWFDRARHVIPGGVQTLGKRPDSYAPGGVPRALVRGKGAYVWDADGNRYLDTVAALGPITLSYGHPAVDSAVKDQLEQGVLFSMLNPVEALAAEKLVAAAPGAGWARFFKTGAEATSAAVRIARAATGRTLIVSSGYHGWHDGWAAARPEEGTRGVPEGMGDYITTFELGAQEGAAALPAIMEKLGDKVAAIVMEPVRYERVEMGPAVQQARALADKHGCLLIFDEVVTGFRVARGGGGELYGVTPDLACWAKGLANGYPLAAVTGKAPLFSLVESLLISSTYGGETLSLAAALATITVYEQQDVIGHCSQLGSRLLTALNALVQKHGLKMIFGGHPMMGGYLPLYEDATINRDVVTLFVQEMASHGVLVRRNGLMFISLAWGETELALMQEAADGVLAAIRETIDAGNWAQRIIGDRTQVSAFKMR